jgi:hypothetical protein
MLREEFLNAFGLVSGEIVADEVHLAFRRDVHQEISEEGHEGLARGRSAVLPNTVPDFVLSAAYRDRVP